MTITAAIPVERIAWRLGEGPAVGQRLTAEETPVAIVHDGSTTAVMMATPLDLEDFGLGFSLSEGLVRHPDEVRDLDIVSGELGIEVRLWLASECSARLALRRRRLAGPTGCGLCGIDSLAEAVKPPLRLSRTGFRITPEVLLEAMLALNGVLPLGSATRAVHAAGLWRDGQFQYLREDVGRHNALDKLIGAAAEAKDQVESVLLLTSRVSVEMVQKAAVLGASVLCAVSAPTALAVRTAHAAGITLVGVARADGFEIFTHSERIQMT